MTIILLLGLIFLCTVHCDIIDEFFVIIKEHLDAQIRTIPKGRRWIIGLSINKTTKLER